MANPFVHVELNTSDLPRAREFYTALFDWELQEVPQFNYILINPGKGTGGGMGSNPAPNTPSHWLAYVEVDDIRASTEKARVLGATILKEPMEVPGAGWLSVIRDPTGAVLGMWQSMHRG